MSDAQEHRLDMQALARDLGERVGVLVDEIRARRPDVAVTFIVGTYGPNPAVAYYSLCDRDGLLSILKQLVARIETSSVDPPGEAVRA